MPPTLVRHRQVTSVLVLSLLLVLMSLPATKNHLLNLIFPIARAATTFTVNSTGDGVDSNLVDGVCNDGTGACTLRAAIQQANVAGGDSINFSTPSGSKIILTGGELLIDKGISIDGPGGGHIAVSGNNASRVLRVTGSPVFLTRLKITEGMAVGGAGIFNDGGDLTVFLCTVSGNNGTTGVGGGISNSTAGQQSGLLNLHSSTISNNTADGGGGGLFQIATAFITNTTISNNSTAGSGGGINNANPATLTNVTITGNTAANGGGIYNPGIGILTFKDTLIAGNSAPSGPDGAGANFVSQDYNLIGNTSGALIVGITTHNITNVNALLGPLTANGGPTFTHALLFGSPAIDAANTALISDQRGEPRPVDDTAAPNAAGGNASDIGAYEAHTLQVNSTADTSDGPCTPVGTGNGCTLREAITAANAEPGSELITFAPALTAGGPATIELLTALPNLSGDMTIGGPGASSLTVQRSNAVGTPRFRIFTILGGGITVSISGLTISNGHTADGTVPTNGQGDHGGGIFNGFNETVNLANVTISGNTTGDADSLGGPSGLGGYGGGIWNEGILTLSNSVISGNRTGDGTGNSGIGGQGGGILNSGTMTITGSTTSNNITGNGILAAGSGGGIASSTSLTVANSTISGNRTGTSQFGGGGGIWSIGNLTVTNTTISGNEASGTGGGINTALTPSTLINVTITNNRSHSFPGGGLSTSTGPVTLRNSLVAGNFFGISPGTTPDDISGTVNAAASSFNLIGTGGSGGLSNGTNNNQVGVDNPKLATLANYGGPTLTHALLLGSPALDAGSNGNLPPDTVDLDGDGNSSEAIPFDQRSTGFNRSMDANGDGAATVDIGAYELQSILVTSTADSGAGTLRQAITDANSNASSDAINFQAGLTGTITLSTALPDLSTSMTINGPGASLLTVQRSNAMVPPFRIFNVTVASPGAVTISGLTISNGNSGGGGGILNASTGTVDVINSALTNNSAISGGGIDNGSTGTVNVTDSILTNNSSAGGFGGGIFNFSTGTVNVTRSTLINNFAPDGSGAGIYSNGGTLTLTNSAVSNNIAAGGSGSSSGGIFSFGGTLTLINSTVTGNGASFAGGIFNQNGTLTLTNSTVSGNTASAGHSGGIFNLGGTLTLTNSTVSGNTASSDGGGIFNSGGTVNLRNTIVANNTVGAGTGPDLNGAFNSQDHNLIENTSGATFTGTVTHNITGLDPLLGPLQNNGGLTQTLALLAGSPALDAGDNCVFDNTCVPPYGFSLTTDQRGVGFARKVDGPDADTTDTVDIGAFEAQVSVADISDQTINEDSSLLLPFNVGGGASITSVTATSSNTTLVPNNPANISISGSGATRTLLINPAANAFGTSTITVTVNGSNAQTMSDTFVLTVNPVNDAPSFTKGPDLTVNENDGAQTVNNWATNISPGAGESGQTLTFIVTNNTNPSLFSVAPAISSSGTLTYSPATGVSGTATITTALMDNGGTASGGADTSPTQTFSISVREGGTLQFGSATFSVGEGTPNAIITVTRTGGTAGEARVNYATSNGTAIALRDYTAASGTLIFADGVTTQNFNVPITDDAPDEIDETVNLTLTSPAGSGTLGVTVNAVLTITDNDPPPSIAISDTSITEGDSGTVSATFTVSMSTFSSQTVTVNFATASGTATAGSDYQTSTGTVTFTPLETTKAVTVIVNSDVSFEANETFFVNLSNPVNATISDSQGLGTILNDDAQGGFISFSQANYTVGESGGKITITVNRSNDLSGAATVDYATSDDSGSATVVPCATVNGIASSRCDFTTALGRLQFAAGESSKTFEVLISQDNYVEGPEGLTLTLSNLTGGALLATPSTATLTITDDATEPAINPIDVADSFVRQHYHDFLNREPDAAGLAFWTDQITSCGTDTACIELRRINVSAAFFLSIEFQQTGYLVERLYKSSYGDAIGTSTIGGTHQLPVPIVQFIEFLPDTQEIGRGFVVGQPGADQVLENNKQAFIAAFVQRSRFTTAYASTLTPAQFVDALFTNTGVTPSAPDRTAAIDEFGGAGTSADNAARARALRRVAENSGFAQQESNKAFVLMQYFGYLRRSPNNTPDSDHSGYEFWLNKLNQFNGNFVNAEMVKAFIISGEYRQRFGP
ncbi:MAG: CSLREA domain-containing protein [Pyrinomonadaceae bacterium]|nr:CSLREA domain-containing protein [Pyrinomonadaceae bacterium]